MKSNYYSKKLHSNKLKECYNLATPRIQKYLEEEIKFVLKYILPTHKVLELGCGYGRVIEKIARKTKEVYGIDISKKNIECAKKYLKEFNNVKLLKMNANSLGFKNNEFDVTIAIQNSISSFKISPIKLVEECYKVTKNGGKILLSSYSEKLWEERLKWFYKQSERGLVGEIDEERTTNGTIICKDGFEATTFSKKRFQELKQKMKLDAEIVEVDNSSIFCIIIVKKSR